MEQNLNAISNEIVELPKNFIVESINDHCMRMAVTEDQTYPWHMYPNSDELFVIIEGNVVIEFANRDRVSLKSGDFFKIKAGEVHRTIAIGRTVNLCFESTGAETVFSDIQAEL